MWSPLDFGKHSGKTLPQVVFTDPDWFFWAHEQGVFSGWYRLPEEAKLVYRRATSIRPPLASTGRPFWVEYLVDRGSGRFSGLQLVPERLNGNCHDRIDMAAPRRLRAYDKTGARILLADVKEIVFGDRGVRLTHRRCDEFFDDPRNFLDP